MGANPSRREGDQTMLRELLNPGRLGNAALQAAQMALGTIEQRGDPVMLQIEVTSRCNFRCSYCIVHNGSGDERGLDMPEDMFQEILSAFPRSVYLQLQGQGEPLLHSSLPNMIRHAKNKGRLVGTVTNGSLWTEARTNAVLDAGIDAVAFSIDLARKKTVEHDRPGMDYDKVVTHLRRALRIRDEIGGKTQIGISCVLKSTTPWDEVVVTVRSLDSLGIDFLMIGPLAGTPTYQDRYPDGMIDGRSDRELLARVMSINTQCKKLNTPRVDTLAGRCTWAWGAALYINADGSVSYCANNHRVQVTPRFEREVGNLRHFRELREEFTANRTPTGCLGCHYLLAHSEPATRRRLPIL